MSQPASQGAEAEGLASAHLSPADDLALAAPASRPHPEWPAGGEIARLSVAGQPEIIISSYLDETQLESIMALMAKDLSEPYSIFTYRRFVHGWPEFTLLAHCEGALVGAIICKGEQRLRHGVERSRGYVAMLAVEQGFRRFGLGRRLVIEALHRMSFSCDELSMETEVTNAPALRLYESLGFVKDKRLMRYYLNGNDAWRLKAWLHEN